MNQWRKPCLPRQRTRLQRGFSLIELMFAITILGILLGFGIPAFRDLMENNSIVANNNELVATLSYARSEAIKRVSPVTVCPSTNGTSCAAATTNWTTGWIIFPDPNSNTTVDAGETILQVNGAATAGVTVNSSGPTSVRFTGTGMLGTAAGNFTVTKTGCTGEKARQVAIFVTGRVTTTRVNCS